MRVNISNSNRDNNIGENIKKLAEIILTLGLISSVICAFVFGKSYDYYSSVFDFWKFIIILLGGGLSSYVSYLFLYGFGTLIDSSINTENNSAKSLKLLEKIVVESSVKKNSTLPKIGGENSLMLYALLNLLAGSGLVGIGYKRRKEN